MSAKQTVPGGMVVIFEGIDGVGKTTQLGLAAEALETDNRLVLTTRVHGGTPFGEALREISFSNTLDRPAEADLYLSLAMHAALLVDLAKEREKGTTILIDRGPLSMAGYQLYGGNIANDYTWQLIDHDVKQFKPDLIILYTATLSTAMQRARQKASANTDRFGSGAEDYFERVVNGYNAAAQRYADVIQTIDVENSSIEQVHEETMRLIEKARQAKVS